MSVKDVLESSHRRDQQHSPEDDGEEQRDDQERTRHRCRAL